MTVWYEILCQIMSSHRNNKKVETESKNKDLNEGFVEKKVLTKHVLAESNLYTILQPHSISLNKYSEQIQNKNNKIKYLQFLLS